MNDEYKKLRDEMAEEYGLAVAKHQWERGPTTNIDGTRREFSNRPDIQTKAAFGFGFDAAYKIMKEREAGLVEAMKEAIEYCEDIDPKAAKFTLMDAISKTKEPT